MDFSKSFVIDVLPLSTELLSEGIYVYPNPVDDKGLHIKLDKIYSLLSFEVIDILGKVVHRKKVQHVDEAKLETHFLQSGTYFIRLIDKKSEEVSKIKFLKK